MILAETDRAASIITLMELLRGAKSKAELRVIRSFFVELDVRIIPVTEVISYAASNLIEDHALADGLRIEDALIAATAREQGETLATGNLRHFRSISNLDLKSFRPRGV
jgi:predicted nucleic acid-binding protein